MDLVLAVERMIVGHLVVHMFVPLGCLLVAVGCLLVVVVVREAGWVWF
jgi:hypothetical protein